MFKNITSYLGECVAAFVLTCAVCVCLCVCARACALPRMCRCMFLDVRCVRLGGCACCVCACLRCMDAFAPAVCVYELPSAWHMRTRLT